ncbi:uncharacterized protein LOC123615024 [Camelus bactrianus]
MQAADLGGGGVAGGAEGQGGPDVPGGQEGPGGGGAGEAGAAAGGAPPVERAPHAPGPGGDALRGLGGHALPGPGGHAAPWPGGHAMPGLSGHAAPGPGGHAAPGPGGHAGQWPGTHAASRLGGPVRPTATGPGSQLLQFSLTVSFPSPVEAEMAGQSLAPRVQPYQGAVQKELIVSGNILAIRLTAGDPGQLRISITSCLNQLSLLVQTMQHSVPLFFTKPRPGNRA